MTLSSAVKKFKSKIGTPTSTHLGSPRRNEDGYVYYPEGEVGYPVSVQNQQKLKETEAEKNTETKEEVVKVQLDIVPGPTEKKRKSSINLYQGVDDDHPDLQSIQNIVANMTFSA